MRRSELESSDPDLFQEVARDADVGYLSLVTSGGWPRSVALNFAVVGETVYFHGALAGEKSEIIGTGVRAGFTMVKPYSFIPSHFTAPDHACPATHFFKSVEIKGRCEPVTDPAGKARGLQALMDKHQPEGRFRPLDPADPVYRKAIERVGVFRVVPDSWTAKRKFGQNEPKRVREMIIAGLRERGGPGDEATILEMEQDLTS